ncbi:MAG: NAD/NADP octopine/nopaline dehydrogenase family protein [Bacteroidaceae bacterium]|nr:NAD/NADP octopine/nopaline dehydrogenase family protein [Bacteroidaceae bacterium]
MKETSICICGGGNLAHTVGGYLASLGNYDVRLLTRHPELWSPDGCITVSDCRGKVFRSGFSVITSDPQTALNGAGMVILCLPGFAIAPVLESIKLYVGHDTAIGSVVSSTGFFLMAQSILPTGTALFGFQRVPFIARTDEYGKSARILGYKPSLAVATLNIDSPSFVPLLSGMFGVPVHRLDNFLMATLTNSNPLLHPSRLYGLFRNSGSPLPYKPLFYEDWDDFSSETLIAADEEFGALLSVLDISRDDIPSILTYYESGDAPSLTRKLRTIPAFKGLYAPVLQMSDGSYRPDFNNRYFSEDFPFGLLIIKCFAYDYGISTPTIDNILEWEQRSTGKEYFTNGRPCGKDIGQTIAPYILKL